MLKPSLAWKQEQDQLVLQGLSSLENCSDVPLFGSFSNTVKIKWHKNCFRFFAIFLRFFLIFFLDF
jgi:hypothetical protein